MRKGALLFVVGVACAEGRLAVRALRSVNPHYPTEAAGRTLGVLCFALVVSALVTGPVRLFTKREASFFLAPTAIALALACVPLPPSDFFANGGTDHWLLVFPPLGFAIAPAAVLLRNLIRGPRWPAVLAQTGLATALVLLGFIALVDGFGAHELSARAAAGCAFFALAALGSLALTKKGTGGFEPQGSDSPPSS